MKSKISVLSLSIFALAMPFIASAAEGAGGISALVDNVEKIIGLLLPMAMSLGVIAFFYGLAKYLFTDGEDKGKGMNIMMMGILAVFVMASLNGIIRLLQDTTNTQTNDSRGINAPCIGSACPGSKGSL